MISTIVPLVGSVMAPFMPLAISQALFTAIVGAGILGSMVVAVIIIGYTIYEFRRHEIW